MFDGIESFAREIWSYASSFRLSFGPSSVAFTALQNATTFGYIGSSSSLFAMARTSRTLHAATAIRDSRIRDSRIRDSRIRDSRIRGFGIQRFRISDSRFSYRPDVPTKDSADPFTAVRALRDPSARDRPPPRRSIPESREACRLVSPTRARGHTEE